MQQSESRAPFAVRVPTGIAGIDTILHGGFFRGASYLITGDPGNGKTIFANQLAFHTVAQGGRVVYVTLLTETHDQLIAQLRPLAFFDPEALGQSVLYLSGTQTLLEHGITALQTLLRDAVRDHGATLLIIDRLTPAETLAASALAFEQFVREVQAWTAAHGCTTVVLTSQEPGVRQATWATLVDGVIRLRDELVGHRAVRFLQVEKFRGSAHLRGQHTFEITEQGLVVYPRVEAMLKTPSVREAPPATRLGTGVPTLDTLLHGGLLAGSITLLIGPAGSGKTSLGLACLSAGAAADETGLYVGFYERPERLLSKADAIGIPLRRAVEVEQVTLCWQPPLEDDLDRLLGVVLAEVRRRGVRRLVIDGLEGLRAAAIQPERLCPAITALANELRALAVTTCLTVEVPELTDAPVRGPRDGLSALTDNVILVRQRETAEHLKHVLQLIKVRDSDYDPSICPFQITVQGITLAAPMQARFSAPDDAGQHDV